jgi:hypothetical protein
MGLTLWGRSHVYYTYREYRVRQHSSFFPLLEGLRVLSNAGAKFGLVSWRVVRRYPAYTSFRRLATLRSVLERYMYHILSEHFFRRTEKKVMPMTHRRFSRPMARPQRRKTQWARVIGNNAAPAATNNLDLLTNWRAATNITQNLPGLTVVRVHLRLSIGFSLTGSETADSGVFLSMFVDQNNAASLLLSSTAPYNEAYMLWQPMYLSESSAGESGAPVTRHLSREFDIKSKRRLQNANDTLWFQIAQTGAVAFSDYNFAASVLVMLP